MIGKLFAVGESAEIVLPDSRNAGRILEIIFEQPFDIGRVAGIQLDTAIPV